jgi:hypothetical protein
MKPFWTWSAVARHRFWSIDYPSLKRAYHANVCDGTQWRIRLDVSDVTKKIYCANYFPSEVRRLADFIGGELLPAHDAEVC